MINITENEDKSGLIISGDEIARAFKKGGVLSAPKNSILLILDEKTEMLSFKSAFNYDTFFTSLIKDTYVNGEQMNRGNAITLFNSISNQLPKGGGGGVIVPGGDGDVYVDCDLEEVNRKLDKIFKQLKEVDCSLDNINGEPICGYLGLDGCALIDEINGEDLEETYP